MRETNSVPLVWVLGLEILLPLHTWGCSTTWWESTSLQQQQPLSYARVLSPCMWTLPTQEATLMRHMFSWRNQGLQPPRDYMSSHAGKCWGCDVSPGQDPDLRPPGDLGSWLWFSPIPGLVIWAGPGFPSLLGLDPLGEVGSLQKAAFLPLDHCLFRHPRAITENPMVALRVSTFRWPRKAKLIFLEHCSGKVAALSVPAPHCPWALDPSLWHAGLAQHRQPHSQFSTSPLYTQVRLAV